ncbi:uncharacterized protein N7477_007778 [Penicillium maclennaniae]|uniref:uncharacterized protein n=1 Tax=Penicillium maclennaniae TaxID=1343394 RepID=UPI0025421ADD|nr:uncharacterized protein N7477_007778 [Penicillium maclennaniae]KAJ5665330.1 hypothetical protein N7477_007778 [Penicillium maclennaniae]
MKYQQLASIGAAIFGMAASVSAIPLAREEENFCPKGYKMVVWYETIWPTPEATSTEISSTPSAIPTLTSTSTSTFEAVTVVQSQTPVVSVSSTPAADVAVVAAISTSTSALAPVPTTMSPTFEAPATTSVIAVPETVQVIVPSISSESSTAETVAPAKVAVVQETTSSTSSSTSSTSTSTSALTAEATSTSSTGSSSSGTSGEATFYGGNIEGGTCSFSGYTLPSGLFGTALSVDQWNDAANCGACVSVTGPNGNSIKAMIVDQCPSCNTNHFDLFENAFGELADISAGIIDIDWSFTSCDLDGPLKLKNKSGTSEYWFSMQVVNANEPVTKLEVSTDGGSNWQSTTRTSYNYFEQSSGFGTDTVTVRVTGKSGNTVVVKDVGCSSESEYTASSNL